MTYRSASLWAALTLATTVAPLGAPLAEAAVGDEFVCHVAFRDANNVKLLGTQVNFAVIREPVGHPPGYDLSTSGSAELHSGAPQDDLQMSLHLDYQHDLRLGADHQVLVAQQLTCLSGTVTHNGVTQSARSVGCDTDPAEVPIVQNAPAFEAGDLVARSAGDQGSLLLACHHLRSILR